MPALVQKNVKIEVRLSYDGAQGLQGDASRLAAANRIRDLCLSRPAVADIHLAFVDLRWRIAHRAKNAAPVRIAAEPACFHKRAVRHGPRDCFGVGCRLRSMDVQGDETRNAFAVSYNHLRQLEGDEVEGVLECLLVGRDAVEPLL